MRFLLPGERRRGVVCASAGNHAQGVALVADLLGIRATIVMPESVPRIKLTQTRLYGDPEIVLHGRDLTQATIHATALCEERGAVFVHPYDDDRIIAGQATIGLELLEQWPDLDCVVVPVGGGGLIAGITVALRGRGSDAAVVGVQAKDADALALSMEYGTRVKLKEPRTVADGIRVGVPGARTLPILRQHGIRVIRGRGRRYPASDHRALSHRQAGRRAGRCRGGGGDPRRRRGDRLPPQDRLHPLRRERGHPAVRRDPPQPPLRGVGVRVSPREPRVPAGRGSRARTASG
jgi:threonine synthase